MRGLSFFSRDMHWDRFELGFGLGSFRFGVEMFRLDYGERLDLRKRLDYGVRKWLDEMVARFKWLVGLRGLSGPHTTPN